MKLFALCIFHKNHKVKYLVSAYRLESFGYFHQKSVKEFMQFTSQILVERTRLNERASVKEEEYMCHVYVRQDGLAACLISDYEYPQRVAFAVLSKILEEFATLLPLDERKTARPSSIVFPACEEYIEQYQDPKEADPLTKLEAKVEDTKIIMHQNIEGILKREENLNDLVEQSEYLSLQSKIFWQTVEQPRNSCCSVQ